MINRSIVDYTILDAATATGAGKTINVSDFRNVVVKIWTASSASLTVKCQWAIWQTAPNFGTAQSVSNHWDYIQMVDLQDGSFVNWDTGFVVTGTDDFRLFEINTNLLNFITFNVTARSAWSTTVSTVLTDNQ